MATTAERPEVKAVAKWVRMSPRKARLVIEHIRGRSVPEARTVLAFTHVVQLFVGKRMVHTTA